MVALGVAVLGAATAEAQRGGAVGRTRAEVGRERGEQRRDARQEREDARRDAAALREEARQDRRDERANARDDREDATDERVESVADEVRLERPELGGSSLRDPSDVRLPTPITTLSPGFGAGVSSPVGAPIVGGGGSDVTFNTRNVINRNTIQDPRVQSVGVPVPSRSDTYVYQTYVRNEVERERRAPQQQRQQLPAADTPLADHTEALRGLIDSNIQTIQGTLQQFRLVDAGKVLEPAQTATLRHQILDSQVATGNRNLLTQSLRERRAIRAGHVVVGVVPARAVILVTTRTEEDN